MFLHVLLFQNQIWIQHIYFLKNISTKIINNVKTII
jgi:hypothetical protein